MTNNMDDFSFADTEVVEAGRVLRYNGPGGRIKIVHPYRMAEWLRRGRIDLSEPPMTP